MLLVVDIGNTNIHMGVWNGSEWGMTWRAQSIADKMPDEYGVLLGSYLATSNLKYSDITGVAIGSVVPPLTGAFVELSRRYLRVDPLVVTHETRTGIRIAIDQPSQAGADRIINAAAVAALYGGPAIVIDFGTATTFDIIAANGAYRGGAIAPGVNLAHDALVVRAARLHKVDLVPPPCAIGTNTIHAMQSGLFWGYVGLVEGLVTRLRAEMREDNIKVIATGGLAPLFKDHTEAIDFIAPQLTLEGLRIIHELNYGTLA
jgi:type III pantothenate kinase